MRRQLAHIGEALKTSPELKASPEVTRDFYREVLEDMTLTPSRNDERPRRVIVEGAVRLPSDPVLHGTSGVRERAQTVAQDGRARDATAQVAKVRGSIIGSEGRQVSIPVTKHGS